MRNFKRTALLLTLPASLVAIGLYAAPILQVLALSVTEPKPGLANYQNLFANAAVGRVVMTTLKVSLMTTVLTVVASYKLPRNWEASGRFRFVSGNPRTPVTGAVYDAQRDTFLPTYGAVNSDRNGSFHQLDLRVDKRWIYDGWMLGAYLDVQNVYNRRNVDETEYNYDFTTSSGDAGLPILPVIGLRGEL